MGRMKQVIISCLASVAMAGAGKDPWKEFGGPNGDGICDAITDVEAYQDNCAITVQVRQNARTDLIAEEDSFYHQAMPSHVFDWNLQNSKQQNKDAVREFAEGVYANQNCEETEKKFFCLGSTEDDGSRTCFLNDLETLIRENRCINLFFTGQYTT